MQQLTIAPVTFVVAPVEVAVYAIENQPERFGWAWEVRVAGRRVADDAFLGSEAEAREAAQTAAARYQ